MAINRAVEQAAVRVADVQLSRVDDSGTASHPHHSALVMANGHNAARDLNDAVHLLCHLYGRHPGLVELALAQCPQGPLRDWMTAASNAFERERLYLVRLTAAIGPLPSTPGAAQTEAALLAQRHAIGTLAASERRGCALGAVTALVIDWPAVRQILDRAGARVGAEAPAMSLPDRGSVAEIIGTCLDSASAERALGFGGEQLLLQNRGLFDLLEARAEARGDF